MPVDEKKPFVYLFAESSLVRFLLSLVLSLHFIITQIVYFSFFKLSTKLQKFKDRNLYKSCHLVLPDCCSHHTQVQLHAALFLLMCYEETHVLGEIKTLF